MYFKGDWRISGGKDFGVPGKTQQSGLGGEKRHSGATELLPPKGRNEGYEACDDAARSRLCVVLPEKGGYILYGYRPPNLSRLYL